MSKAEPKLKPISDFCNVKINVHTAVGALSRYIWILTRLTIGSFRKWDNFPDRFGSDIQKSRFKIGQFGSLLGTDSISSYPFKDRTNVRNLDLV